MDTLSILAFVRNNWKAIAVGGLILAIVVYVETLRVDLALKETKIANITAENTTLKNNYDTLSLTLTTQNKALDALSKLATDTQASFDELNASVKKQSAALDLKLKGIAQEKKPQTCNDTIKYLIDAKGGYNQ